MLSTFFYCWDVTLYATMNLTLITLLLGGLMNPLAQAYENQAHTIIKALEKRNMTGYYFGTAQEARDHINQMIEDHSTVTWGGSMTLNEIGIKETLKDRSLNVLDRADAKTPEEVTSIYQKAFSSDYYLMSTNAITLDGQLINIDGNGNRVAALIWGPKQVIIVAGMNKVALDEPSGIERVRNFASPPNTVRLNLTTPCQKTGKCHDCLVDDCICCQVVTTRKSRHKNRIHVILVGETLGY